MEEKLDIREKGGVRQGERQVSDTRLFMQLLAFGNCTDSGALAQALERAGIEAVLYEDVNDPRGVALLTWNENPEFFITTVRPLALKPPFIHLTPKPEYTMLGRTYALGYEPDLQDWLLHKPRRTVLDRDNPWAVWYPLRRTGAFSALPPSNPGARK